MRRRLLLARYALQPWALTPEYMALAGSVLARWAAEETPSAEVLAEIEIDKQARSRRRDDGQSKSAGTTAVIPVYGVMTQRPPQDISGPGGTSTLRLVEAVKAAAADPSISQILLDIDSPGGSVHGTQEAADAIWAARQQKPVVAVANSLAASAAYWLGSQASEFYATPSGELGSIGVYTAHQFIGKAMEQKGIETTLIAAGPFKTEGNPFEPLGEAAKSAIQARVDEYYQTFVEAVARGRGMSSAQVLSGMGQGRVLNAAAALKEGMIDGIATFDEVLANLKATSAQPSRSRVANARRELAIMDAMLSHTII